MNRLDQQRHDQTEKIKALGIQPGWFAQLDSWFGDVWGMVTHADNEAGMLTLYDRTDRQGQDATTVHPFWAIRTAVEKLPDDTQRHRVGNCSDVF